MNDETKIPEIGLLGIMQELYDEMLPEIVERQHLYGLQIVEQLSGKAIVHFPKPARNQKDIENIVKEFNVSNLDGIMIVMMTYGPSLRTVRALQENNLPILLANIQPEHSITANWDMGDLTYNQGVHGAQDMANTLLRTGIPFDVISEDWKSDDFLQRFSSWVKVVQTIKKLKNMKIALFGYGMNGMGDIVGDESTLMRVIGPVIVRENLGELFKRIETVSIERIIERKNEHAKQFLISSELPVENHDYAVKMELALQDMLIEKGYAAFSMHFEPFGKDGRFSQLPLLAASNLMANGYGYGAEGDIHSATLVTAGHSLFGDAHFTEMYAMDFTKNSILMSHMGEGNWKIARRDRPVKLIDRKLGIGGLGNPPTVVFMAEPGPATLASLVALGGDEYRLVVAFGEILDTEELPTIEMPYFQFQPLNGVRKTLDSWLKHGGTHHQCLNLGDNRKTWKLFCEYLGIEYVEV